MTRADMLRAVDEEIRRLESIRDQLRELQLSVAVDSKKRRNLSADGRQRIVEAQQRRWASQKNGSNQAKSS